MMQLLLLRLSNIYDKSCKIFFIIVIVKFICFIFVEINVVLICNFFFFQKTFNTCRRYNLIVVFFYFFALLKEI